DKINVVHRGGDHVATRMTVCGHGSGQVNEVHQASAKEVAERISVVGEHDFGHFGTRFSNGTRSEFVVHSLEVPAARADGLLSILESCHGARCSNRSLTRIPMTPSRAMD